MDNQTVKSILGAGVGLQSVALLGQNYKFTTKAIKSKSLKSSTKGFVNLGFKNIVGINLIKAQSDIIKGI